MFMVDSLRFISLYFGRKVFVLRTCSLNKENFFPVGNPYKSLSAIHTAGDLFSEGTTL